MSTILFAFNFQECKLTFLETNQFINGSISLPKGNLVKIQYENMNYKAQIFECEGKELQQSDHYLCDLKDFTVINEKLWWMLIGVRNIKNRLKIIERENFQKFLMRIQLNSICYVNAQIFNTKENLKCSVQYIGEVPEIGPGYFIGFLIVVGILIIMGESQFYLLFFIISHYSFQCVYVMQITCLKCIRYIGIYKYVLINYM